MTRINDHYLKLAAGYLFPEIARRVDTYCQEHPDRAGHIIRCGIGDVTEPLPPAVREAMHRGVDELGDRGTFRGYGPPFGYDFVREAIAQHDFANHGLTVGADEVYLSDGSKGDCGAILDILGPGNRIGITDPVYPVYVDSNVMAGNTGAAEASGRFAGLTYLPCTPENGFVPDIPSEPLDVIYLCYPNNPTGGMITHDKLAAWVEFALRHDALILYDVAYQAYITETDVPRSIYEIDGAAMCAMEFHSFSKNGGFTGVRCGYTVCPNDLFGSTAGGERVQLAKLWRRRWSTKSNGVSYPVQCGAAAIYSDDGRVQVGELVEHYLGNAAILRDGCQAMGLTVYGGVNAPYVWVQCPEGISSWDMFDRMLEQLQVVITPGVGFGSCGEGFFRISAFNSRANVEQVVKRMQAMQLQTV